MGLFSFVKDGVREMMIARPDNLKHLIVYKHPDQTVPWGAQLTVDSDEGVVFFKDGQVMGVLGAGRHTLKTSNIPFLSNFVDSMTGGNVFIAEVFFVLRRPVRDLKFGGQLLGVRCPVTTLTADMGVFGTYILQVLDPARFITEFTGQAAVSGDNDQMLKFVADRLMTDFEYVVTDVLEQSKRPLSQISGQKRQIEKSFKDGGAPELESIGLRVTGFGRFQPKLLKPDEEKKIDARYDKLGGGALMDAKADAEIEAAKKQALLDQEFAMDSRYANLAGQNPGYMAAAQADALRSAGEGMAKGGGDGGGIANMGAQMAVGMGMGGMFNQGFQQQQPAMNYQRVQPQQGQSIQCGGCGTPNAGGKFCANCGQPLAPPQAVAPKFCNNCGNQLGQGKFCQGCGAPAGPPPAAPPGGYPPAPQGGMPPQGGAPPQGAPPQGAPPAQGAPPQGAPPAQGGPPQGAAPQAAPPQAAPPQAAPPQAAPPQPGYPQAPPAQPGYPQAPPAQPGYPQAPQGQPQPGYPQAPQGQPQPGYPQAPQGGQYQGGPPQGGGQGGQGGPKQGQ